MAVVEDFGAAAAEVFPAVVVEAFRAAVMAAVVITAAVAVSQVGATVVVTLEAEGVRRSASGAVLAVVVILLDQAAEDAAIFLLPIFRAAMFRGRPRERGPAGVACRRVELSVHQRERVLQPEEVQLSYHRATGRVREREAVLRKNLLLEPNQRVVRPEPSQAAANLPSFRQKVAVTFSARRQEQALLRA